jgi:type VI secretion system protein ImpF
MARKIADRELLPSVIDRLIDREPHNRNEAQSARAQSIKELKDSIRRDLEWLLNTRRTPAEPPATARELWRSVYCYGLPDITGMAVQSSDDQTRLARTVESTIAAFEPRLLNVTVSLLPSNPGSRRLRFKIEALLRTDPAPARISFDTTLELTSGEYDVEDESRAR